MAFEEPIIGASGAAAAGYTIEQSCRFNDDDTAFLSRTPRVTGNRRTWTFSTWLKRGNITKEGAIFSVKTDGDSDAHTIRFTSADAIDWFDEPGGSPAGRLITTQLFRDPGAWLHLVAAWDSTNATAGNRMRLYINGSEVTDFSTDTNPVQNIESAVNKAGAVHHICGDRGAPATAYIFDGYLADVHLIDGQQLAPSDFGETDDQGNWVPTEYESGSVGSAATVAFGSTDSENTNASEFTFTGMTINTADADRKVVATVYGSSASATANIDTLTIGGIAAKLVIIKQHSVGAYTEEIWIADVPTGTTATMVITWNTTMDYCGASTHSVVGVNESHFDVGDLEADGSVTMTVPAGGIVIAGGGTNSGSGGVCAWSGNSLAEDYDDDIEALDDSFSGASVATSSKITEGSFTSTWTNEGSRLVIAFAAWGPTDTTYGTNGFRLDFADSSYFGSDVGNFVSTDRNDFMEDITAAGLTSNLEMVLDAGDTTSYTSGQKWVDLSGNGIDFFRGAGDGSAADDPTFNGTAGGLSDSEYFSTDGADHFVYDSSAETWMQNLHKDGATYSMIFLWYYKASTGQNQMLFDTRNSSGKKGLFFGFDTNNKIEFRVSGDSSTSHETVPATVLVADSWNMIGVSINENGGSSASFHYLNGAFNQVSSADYFDGALSSPSTDEGDPPKIWESYDGGSVAVSGTRLAGLAVWEGSILTKANMDTLYARFTKRFAQFTDSGLATNDQTKDSPSDSADDDVGNYATANRINSASTVTLSNGGLNLSVATAGNGGFSVGTLGMTTGKWYWEWEVLTGSDIRIGIVNTEDSVRAMTLGSPYYEPGEPPGAGSWIYSSANGQKYNGGTGASYGNTYTAANDICGIAFDADNGTLWFSKNGTYQNSATIAEVQNGTTTNAAYSSLSSDTYFPIIGTPSGSTQTGALNFGQQALSHTVPTGYKRLCTANLAAPAIKDPSKFFQVDTFSGTGSELVRTLTDAAGGAVKPDLVWIKDRDTVVQYVLTDSARGATKEINSDDELDETTVAQGLKSFDTSGYTLGTDGNYNTSSSPNVAWCWNTQGGAGASNEDGSINTTTTSVGAAQGFSISTYTGTGSAATIGHGLGAVPELIMIKARAATNTEQWRVFHTRMDTSSPEDWNIRLDTVAARVDEATAWNDTLGTTSVFTIGTHNAVNENTKTFVAYCWAGVEGYSKFSSYIGNGNADGTFVWCGFRPKMVWVRNISQAANWRIFDASRDEYNEMTTTLGLDTDASEASQGTGNKVDFLSNGFKARANTTDSNQSGDTLIFAAFAEAPFGGDGVSQARAR